MSEPARAVAYVRVSTAKQGESLDVQLDRIRKYAELQGLDLDPNPLVDEAVSGGKPLFRRPAGGGGATLARLTRSGRLSHVVALKLDRLFRDAADALTVTREWDRAGVTLHIVDMGGTMLSTGGPMGRMILTLLAGFAEWERSVIGERTANALAYKRERGEVYGPVPYGYDRAPGDNRLRANPEQLAVVRGIFADRAAGASLWSIAARLNHAGVPTRDRARWYPSTIRAILRGPIHAPKQATARRAVGAI